MRQVAFVVSAKPDHTEVVLSRHTECRRCGACLAFDNKAKRIEVVNEVGARRGDQVEIESDPRFVVISALWIFLVPLIVLIIGVLIGYNLAGRLALPKPLSSLVFGGAAAVIYFMILRLANTSLLRGAKPRIISILHCEDSQG